MYYFAKEGIQWNDSLRAEVDSGSKEPEGAQV
jgi:hypothetical protein